MLSDGRVTKVSSCNYLVLILVVMEDALWPTGLETVKIRRTCLNPCCNGRCSLTLCPLWIRSRCTWVLILVVMEDALWLCPWRPLLPSPLVLILVVMEDALWLILKGMRFIERTVLILVVMEDALWQGLIVSEPHSLGSLNPCCNGRCSLTCETESAKGIAWIVLILVVMEDALWQWNPYRNAYPHCVLILVVMEDALWQKYHKLNVEFDESLNPCCNGRCSLTVNASVHLPRYRLVLILVVMEDALWLYFSLFIEYQYFDGDKRSKNDSY